MVLKFVDAGVKRLGARGRGEGAEESPFTGDRVSVLQDGGKNSREGGGGGDGCDMTGNPRMLPNWTPTTGVPARKSKCASKSVSRRRAPQSAGDFLSFVPVRPMSGDRKSIVWGTPRK